MVKINKIYTKTGDDGTTGLADGSRVLKFELRPEAYGTVDELNSIIGLIISHLEEFEEIDLKKGVSNLLQIIQNDLFDLGADLSTPVKNKNNKKQLRIIEKQISKIEREIDKYNSNLKSLSSFILPGGTVIASWFHIARTVTRRAERIVVELNTKEKINFYSLVYLNRLSDLLFVLSRVFNKHGTKDILWIPGENQN